MVVVFKKLFGSKKSPTKNGDSGPALDGEGGRWVKRFSLELSNMEDTPVYQLTHQLSIGSEIGNIVVADPSVSPRHCTFILQDEVVSVLDHGSVSGTLVNGKKIHPGRYIILEESDLIRVGDLEVKIRSKNELAPTEEHSESTEEVHEPEEEVEPLAEEETEEIDDDPEEIKIEPKKKKFSFSFGNLFKRKLKAPKPVNEKKETKKPTTQNKGVSAKDRLSISIQSSYATNALVRVLAVICDLLVAYCLYVILYPFDEFRHFMDDVPSMIEGLLAVDFKSLWAAVTEDYQFLTVMLEDLMSFLSSTFHVGPMLILFIIVRLVTTLMFGVSISEAILGVRSKGNMVWSRVGGVLRVLIGVVTGPFLIFDIPALVSRRTFKEFMTFTHTYLSSKFICILGLILYLPLLVGGALLSPLFEGFEVPEPIVLNDRLEQRVKAAKPEEVTAEEEIVSNHSEFLHMELAYDKKSVSIIPSFKFQGKEDKLNYKPSLTFYQRDLQRTVQFEVFKTFDMKELLGIGIKGNFFLFDQFPAIYDFVYSSNDASPSFKAKNDEKANRKFATEIVSFTKQAFEISADNAFDVMQTFTPLLKGLMDYRQSFLALIEYKEFSDIKFVKLGNAYFLKISYIRQKPFDLIIPLMKGEGRIYKIEFDKKDALSNLLNKFYKFDLERSNWFPDAEALAPQETLGPLEVMDFFIKNAKDKKINPEKAQALYGYYFEKSADVLSKGDQAEYALWQSSVDSALKIISSLKTDKPAPKVEAAPETLPDGTIVPPTETPAEPVEVDPKEKLIQNFQDLKNAVEIKNMEYFGVQSSANI